MAHEKSLKSESLIWNKDQKGLIKKITMVKNCWGNCVLDIEKLKIENKIG